MSGTKQSNITKTEGVWTHVQSPDAATAKNLAKQFNINERFIWDALDTNEIPRFEADDTYVYIITRFAYKASGKAIKTSPILFVLNHTKLITISSHELPDVEIGDTAAKQFDSKNPVLTMLRIFLMIDAEYDRYLHETSGEINKFFNKIGHQDVGPKGFIRFVHIENGLNGFLNSLRPTNSILSHLLASKQIPDFSTHRELVQTVILNNEQSIGVCEASLKHLDAIRRTFDIVSSISLNRTMKILALTSVFISIPTMFFSLYGMNVKLPMQQHGVAFGIIMFICILTVLSAFYFARKHRIF